jgi:hypothetical protein
VASTRRHFYAAAGSRSTPPAESIDIGMVELWEDGKPGPRKLAIPMDDRSLTFGDGVRVWKSYRDGRYHFERDYPDRH